MIGKKISLILDIERKTNNNGIVINANNAFTDIDLNLKENAPVKYCYFPVSKIYVTNNGNLNNVPKNHIFTVPFFVFWIQ